MSPLQVAVDDEATFGSWKELLRPDGILIVTIDENEVGHLSVLLEMMFPEYLRHMVAAVINPKGTGKLNFGG